MSPVSFLQRPARWMQLLVGNSRAFPAAPNLAFELATRKKSDQDMAGLDLGDVLGMAEATVYVATREPDDPPEIVHFESEKLAVGCAERRSEGGTPLVSYGMPGSPMVRIADPRMCIENTAGKIGEIWVHGDNVASGYRRNPRSWRLTFGGRNHYPDDLEATIQEITGGRAAAFSVTNGQRELLVFVVEFKNRGSSDEEILDRLHTVKRQVKAAVLKSHGVRLTDLVLVQPGEIPITTSGKVRRPACAERYGQDDFTRLDVSA